MRRSHYPVAAATALMLLVSFVACDAQPRELTITPHLTLQGPFNGRDLDRSGIAQSSCGSYVVSVDKGTAFAAFDSAGKPIRIVGREGDGPGEFRQISALRFTTGDSVLVVEASRRRVHLFSPDFRPVRTLTLSYPTNQVLHLPNGNIAASAPVRGRAGAIRPVQLYGGDPSDTMRFLGAPTRSAGRGMPDEIPYALALGARGTMWATPANELALSAWSGTAPQRDTIAIHPEWFATPSVYPATLFDAARPQVRIADLMVDTASNTAVLLFMVPARDWKRATDTTFARRVPFNDITLEYLDRFFDSRLLAVDLRSGRIIAESYQDQRLMKLLDARTALSITEDDDGFVTHHVHRLKYR